MKAKQFVRDHVLPNGGVLYRRDGDHHVFKFPNGMYLPVPMGGRQSEASFGLERKLKKILRAMKGGPPQAAE
jgi:hypothetical protein